MTGRVADNALALDEVARLIGARRFGAAWSLIHEARTAAGVADADLLAAEALVLARWGRLREAARKAVSAAFASQGPGETLAAVFAVLGERGIAVESIPEQWQGSRELRTKKVLADALRSQHRHGEAIPLLRELIVVHPDDVEVRMALADCLIRTGRDDAALECLEGVIARDAGNHVARAHIAAIHTLAGRHADALAIGDTGQEIPVALRDDVRVNAAISRFHLGDVALCRDALLDVLPGHPNLDGHLQLGPVLLTLGDCDEGFRQYEFRWMTGQYATQRPGSDRPHWNGQDLRGKRILVIREQGIGDAFQFARYLPLLRDAGAKVILASFDPIATIATRHFAADVVLRDGEPVPEHDYFAQLMSLPRVFGTTAATIPAPLDGLAPTPERARYWQAAFAPSGRLRVGVVWAGRPEHLRDRQRSVPLATLAPILGLPGVQFVGMQKGPAVAQAECVPESIDWFNVGPELDTLDDAIAVLDRLDGLVCVDTALAHIAATLGKPVWMLVSHPPDFRWGLHGRTTHWYPSMRLFRQRVPGDWTAPVRELAQAVAAFRDTGKLARFDSNDAEIVDSRASGSCAAKTPRPRLARALPMRHGFMQYEPTESVVGASLEHYGEWIEPALARVLAHLAAGAVVVEANPGAGAHSLPMGKRLGPEGHLLLFEPRAFHRRMLDHNLKANGVANATLLARALGAAGEPGDADAIDDLRLDRVDAIVLHSGTVAPASIVEAASATLWRCRPVVAVYAPHEAHLADVVVALRDRGYASETSTIPVFASSNYNRVVDDRTEGATVAALFARPEERIDLST